MIKVRDSYLTEHKQPEHHGIQDIELKDFDAHLYALFIMTFFCGSPEEHERSATLEVLTWFLNSESVY